MNWIDLPFEFYMVDSYIDPFVVIALHEASKKLVSISRWRHVLMNYVVRDLLPTEPSSSSSGVVASSVGQRYSVVTVLLLFYNRPSFKNNYKKWKIILVLWQPIVPLAFIVVRSDSIVPSNHLLLMILTSTQELKVLCDGVQYCPWVFDPYHSLTYTAFECFSCSRMPCSWSLVGHIHTQVLTDSVMLLSSGKVQSIVSLHFSIEFVNILSSSLAHNLFIPSTNLLTFPQLSLS